LSKEKFTPLFNYGNNLSVNPVHDYLAVRVPANGSEKQKRHSDSYADGFDELLRWGVVGMVERPEVASGTVLLHL
jgi:hypothetical protein